MVKENAYVVAAGALPEGKGVDHDDVGGTDDGVAGTISKLVPRVGSANLDALGQLALDCANLLLQLGASEVAAVEGLGADGDGVDGIGVGAGDIGDSLEILLEGLLDIGPRTYVSLLVARFRFGKSTDQIPRTTLKPLLLAAGRMFLAESQSEAEYPRTMVEPELLLIASKSSS